MKLNLEQPELCVFYRLSDKGENKEKISVINNKNCLENFLREFPSDIVELIADNVEEETKKWLEGYNFKQIHYTQLGNSGSFWYAYQLAINLPKATPVYLVENDYIHRPFSHKVLLEGLKISDYLTLYDHPDKFVDGINPQVRDGGEKTKVFLTNSTHWKITNSTTMTFASKAGILKKDLFIFKFYTIGLFGRKIRFLKFLSTRKIPSDYKIFVYLSRFKRRRLISPIPGFSTHGEQKYLSPLIDWTQYI